MKSSSTMHYFIFCEETYNGAESGINTGVRLSFLRDAYHARLFPSRNWNYCFSGTALLYFALKYCITIRNIL